MPLMRTNETTSQMQNVKNSSRPERMGAIKKLRIDAYSLPFMDGNRVNYSATICTHLYSTLKHQHTAQDVTSTQWDSVK